MPELRSTCLRCGTVVLTVQTRPTPITEVVLSREASRLRCACLFLPSKLAALAGRRRGIASRSGREVAAHA